MSWKMLTLTNIEAAGFSLFELQEAFSIVFASNGAPKDAAMFARGAVAPVDEVYFSPKAAMMFEQYLTRLGAQSTNAPSSLGTMLLVGSGTPQDMLSE